MSQDQEIVSEREQLFEELRRAPKVELHVHLEGSIRPETLLELARRNRVDLPADDLKGLRRWFTYTDFDHFIQVYLAITKCLRTRDDYELIVHEFGAEMARQNIKYAEATFTPGTHRWLGVPFEVYFEGLRRGREAARRDFGVEMNWVFDIVRNVPEREREGDYTLAVALEGKSDGVVALGLGGKEPGFPCEPYAKWFEKALSVGLHSAPHAGELSGPESIWGAIKVLGAERIGHGVRAIDDPKLIEYLREHEICLEVCPTSNLRLGVFSMMQAHPIKRLHDEGVVVTINSDDPPLFNTTMNEEWVEVARAHDFTLEQLDEIRTNAAKRCFLSPEKKAALLGEMQSPA